MGGASPTDRSSIFRALAEVLVQRGSHSGVYRLAAGVLVLAIFAALITTLRSWIDWGGDEAQYLMNARAIALGQPYGVTQYIHNPLNAIHPAAPPVGFPLLLAPVYKFWGLDWQAYKVECIVVFGLFLAMFAIIAGERLGAGWALVAIALIGLHPYTWEMKETIPPEFPFMFFAYTALWLADRAMRSEASADKRLKVWCVLGAACCIAAAYLTRPIGIVLLPAIVLAALFQSRKLLNAAVIAVVVGFALAWCVNKLFHPDFGTYVSYLHAFGLQSIQRNLKAYGIALRYFLEDHTYARTSRGLALLIGVMAAVVTGFIVRARTRFSSFEWFTLGYAGLLLIYPISVEPDRYSYPLWPLLLLYALVGCEWLGSHVRGFLRFVPATLLVAMLGFNFAAVYHRIVRHSGPNRDDAEVATTVYRYLEQHLPGDAVVIARQPTVIALLSRRRSAIWPAHCDDQQFRAYMESIGARYMLMNSDDSSQNPGKLDELASFVSHNRDSLQPLYSHGTFTLYRLRS